MKNNISNCSFTGVHFDPKIVNTIETIAQGLVENAKALGALASVLKASNVHIDSLMQVSNSKKED